MRITVIVVGRARGVLAEAIAEYEARASRYWSLEVIEVSAGTRGGPTPERALAAESERILARLPAKGGEIVALTRTGKGIGSRELERYLVGVALSGTAGPTFLIGGAFGLGPEVLARAGRRISLSRMTLPHEMARLVLAEQLYRAGTLARGEPYHKGA